MKRAWLLLLVLACGDKGSNSNDYRIGSQCSSAGTCPPGQMCISGNICSRPCGTPGIGGSECSSPCGGNNCMFSCDIDRFCKQGCNPGGGPQCAQGSCAGSEICDSMYNVCRVRCGGTDGGACPSGQECVTDPNNTSCTFCRPAGGVGTFGHPCNPTGGCNGGGLVCDSVTHTCQYACGNGSMTCGTGPNCPNGFGCEPSTTICRPLCQGGSCPDGTCTTAGQCQLCIPSGPP